MTFNVKEAVQRRIAVQQQSIGNTLADMYVSTNPLAKYEQMDFGQLDAVYASLEKYVRNVANSRFRGLIVSGPPGVGKTYTVTNVLSKYATGKVKVVAGHMSLITLFGELYRHRDAGDIVVLDDIDSVFSDIKGANLIKAAVDTISQRRISWATASNVLSGWGIPTTFDYNGGIILISNETQRQRKNSKISQHIGAISDRLFPASIGSNDKEEQFHQLCYRVVHHGLLDSQVLTPIQQRDVLNFIAHNLDRIDYVSLRTAKKIAELMNAEPNDWRDMAKMGILNNLGD